MSTLEKVIFLADSIEPGRSYPGVEEIRQIAENDLDLACLMCLERTIDYINKKGYFLDPDTLDSLVLTRYRLMMERYFQQRELIPDENIAEVRYEDLVSQPLQQLRGIYVHLGLDGWENARPDIERYVDSLAGYQAGQYRFTQAEIEKVERHCGLAINRFGYGRPQTV